MSVTFDEKPLDVHVTLDFSTVTYGDTEKYQELRQAGKADEASAWLQELIVRVIGQPLSSLPATVALEVGTYVVERLAGTGAQQKN